MTHLDWHRAADMGWLPPNAPLSFGKAVILRGYGYDDGDVPTEFRLHRLCSPIVRWGLRRTGRQGIWDTGASRPALSQGSVPFQSYSTDPAQPVLLAPGGVFHTHRWLFTDDLGNKSVTVRTTRVSTAKVIAKGGMDGVSLGVEAQIQAAVDPSLRIDLSLPWEGNEKYPTPQALIRAEVDDLNAETELSVDPEEVLGVLGSVFPSTRPDDVSVEWEPRYVDIGEGDTVAVDTTITLGSEPFAVCFTLTDTSTSEVVGASEVAVVWRDDAGVLGMAFQES